MREYIRMRPRSADIDKYTDGENYLGRTIYEDFELIDAGVLDAAGNKIMARQKLDPIGFVRFK